MRERKAVRDIEREILKEVAECETGAAFAALFSHCVISCRLWLVTDPDDMTLKLWRSSGEKRVFFYHLSSCQSHFPMRSPSLLLYTFLFQLLGTLLVPLEWPQSPLRMVSSLPPSPS